MRLILFLQLLHSFANASKILFVVPTNSKSHLGSLLPLAQALSNHGHDVTMYVEVHRELGTLKNNVKSHYVMLPHDAQDKVLGEKFRDIIWNRQFSPDSMVTAFEMGKYSFVRAIKQESFWAIMNQTWDFILGDEICTPAAWALGLTHKERYDTPYAVGSTTYMLHIFTTMLSLNRNPINSPSYYTKLAEPLQWHVENFLDRMTSLWYAITEYVAIGIIVESDHHKTIEIMNYLNFTWSRFYRGASLIFSDFPERLAWPMPIGNEIIYTGSICHHSKPLPMDLEEFVSDSASKGTILVAFGSWAQWDFTPRRIVNALLEAVNNLTDYRIIWSYEGQQLAVKNHVKLMSWIPQNDLLNHPKTKLFISHGGLKSVKEAICSETPVVNMPLLCEQVRNALMGKQLGYADYLNKLTVDTEQILSQISKVLNNFDTYHKEVRKTKSFFLDHITDPLEEAVFWTEKSIRYGKRPLMFQRAGMKLNWVQFLLVDVGVLLLSSVILFG